MSKPRLLCCAKNTFCKKIFSAHRRWKMALALSWSKISTRERKCDKQSVALWTLCALFSWGSLRGHTWKFLFFRVPTNLWSTYKIQASRFEELSGAGTVRVRGQMKNGLVDEKYESFESFLSCHPLSPRERWGGKREQFSGISTWMIDGGNNFIQQLVKNKYYRFLESTQKIFKTVIVCG